MVGPKAAERRIDGGSGPSVEDYRSAAPQLRAARIGIGIALGAAVLNGFVSLVAAAVTGWAIGIDPAGAAAPLDNMAVSAAAADLLGKVMGIATAAWLLLAVALLAAGVNLIRWQLVAVTNMAALGHRRHGPAPWVAAAGWIVPIWSFFAPKRSFDDLWRASEPAAADPPARSALQSVRVPALHSVWWGLWVSAWLLSVVGAFRMTRHPTLGTMLTEQFTLVVVDTALVGAGLLLLRIVTLTTARQDARYAERPAALAPP